MAKQPYIFTVFLYKVSLFFCPTGIFAANTSPSFVCLFKANAKKSLSAERRQVYTVGRL